MNEGGRGPIVDGCPLGRRAGGGSDKGFYLVRHSAIVKVSVYLRYDRFDPFRFVGHEAGWLRTRIDERRESVGKRRPGHQKMDKIFRADEGIGECDRSFGKRIGRGSSRRRTRSVIVF